MADAIGVVRRSIPWTRQPPVGTPVAKSSLTQGLFYCITFNRGIPFNEVDGTKGSLRTSALIRPTDMGLALDCSVSSTDAGDFPKNDAAFSGLAAMSVMVVAKNRKTLLTANPESALRHSGSGDDPFSLTWETSENFVFQIDIGASSPFDSIGDGLHPTNGTPADQWNVLGGIFANSVITVYINKIAGSGAAAAGTISVGAPDTNHLQVSNGSEESNTWDGWNALSAIWNRGLSVAEWNSLVDNPWQLFQPRLTLIGTGIAPAAGGTMPSRLTLLGAT